MTIPFHRFFVTESLTYPPEKSCICNLHTVWLTFTKSAGGCCWPADDHVESTSYEAQSLELTRNTLAPQADAITEADKSRNTKTLTANF
jgi:hypothetical protein